MRAIEANGLAKCYGTIVAVVDLSFAVEPAEILGVLGDDFCRRVADDQVEPQGRQRP